MTYKEALENGYENFFTALQRGYVSRKANPDDLPVKEAGGRLKGMKYVLLPHPVSTQYCIRQYLRRKK